MTTDELIEKALTGSGQMIGGKEAFVLEGNAERNIFRIVTADEAFMTNCIAFAYGISHGFMFMGMFTTREAAEESMEFARSFLRDEDGNILLSQPKQ